MVCLRNMVILLVVLLAVLDTSAQVHADFRYAGGVIETDSALMSIAENRNRMLTNFLAHTIGKDASIADYRDSFYAVNDSPSGQFSFDLVYFPAPDEPVKKWLDRLLTNDYIMPDIPSEAPEKCLAFHRDGTLIIVWCNLFADTKEIVRLTEEYLQSQEKRNNIPMASEPQN